MSAAFALLRRDLQLATRVGGGGGMALFFFLIVVTILPLGLGPDLALLRRIAPGMLWIALLLSALLTLDRLLQADFEDGSLDQLLVAGLSPTAICAMKALGHWLTTGLPLVVAMPFVGLLLNVAPGALPLLALTMLIGTPALSFLGMIGAALTMGVRRGGLLAALLILPFYIPVLIFGVGAVSTALNQLGGAATQNLMLLGAVTLVSLVVGPLAGGAALRANLT